MIYPLLLGRRNSKKNLHAIITHAAEKIPRRFEGFRGVEKEVQQTAQTAWIKLCFYSARTAA
jgi:hypothetical protein